MRAITLSALALALSAPAFADVVIVTEDGGQISADISLESPTRIVFEHDGGSQLIFNTPDGNTPVLSAVSGETGDIFVSVTEGHPGQSISGFVTTIAGRTYKVRLNIKQKDAEQITIASKEARAELAERRAKSEAPKEDNLPTIKWKRHAGYHQSVAMLMRALYYNGRPEGFAKGRGFKISGVSDIMPKTVAHWKTDKVELAKVLVSNPSNSAIFLPDRKEVIGDYIAVAFSDDYLMPGQDAIIYVVRDCSCGAVK